MIITARSSLLQRYSFLALLLLASMFCVRSVSAEQVLGLYDVTVPVASQSAEDLRKAGQAGLATVFVRVSGQRAVLQNPQIAAAVRRAQDYIKQFQYTNVATADGQGEQLSAVFAFSREQVEAQLRAANVPLWSGNRPSILLWMVIEDAEGRRFVGVDSPPELVRAIKAYAEQRGLVVKLPALDLEDMVALTPDQLWSLDANEAQAATERYRADTVLLARATQMSGGQWLGASLYQFNQQQLPFERKAETLELYIESALDQVAGVLSSAYAIAPIDIAAGGLLLRVTGVSNFVDYARVIAYLQSVAAIRQTEVMEINGDEIIVRLVADGLLEQLQQAFVLDQRLLPTLEGNYQGSHTLSLDYHWAGAVEPQL